MINDIFDGISIKLKQAFGDECRIYSDVDVDQGLREPCFFISAVSPSRTQVVGARYLSENNFDIHYFPRTRGGNAEMLGAVDILFEALEYITLIKGDLLRGIKMHSEIADGVLHFFVSYNLFLRREDEKDAMETIDIITGTVEE